MNMKFSLKVSPLIELGKVTTPRHSPSWRPVSTLGFRSVKAFQRLQERSELKLSGISGENFIITPLGVIIKFTAWLRPTSSPILKVRRCKDDYSNTRGRRSICSLSRRAERVFG